MYTEDEKTLITLCSFEELTYNIKFHLLGGLESNKPDFVKFEPQLIKSLSRGVYNKIRDKFFDEKYRQFIFEELEKRKVFCVTYFSSGYPELLKQTPYPPLVLYCKGNINLLNTRLFAVVGSRRTPPNMIAACKKISSELTQHFTVVTGMADGADSAAIEGALPSGKIISVLANGFDYCYPAVNKQLTERVEKSGLLISEYTPETSPKQFNFPVRNRIIAGLSEGTLVVSAPEKSGALITADYTVEYSRELFAFPYSVGIKSGVGCNGLIKKGALLTENILDIFSVFDLEFKEREKAALTETEAALLALIREEGEIFAPAAAEKLNTMPYKLIPVLSSLEIKGLIVRLGGNRFAAL